MIHPEHKLKAVWDFLVLAVAIFATIEIPLSIIFGINGPSLVLSNLMVSVVFILDIAVRFNTAFSVQGRLLSSRRAAAARYLRTWLWIDLLAAVPMGAVLSILPLSASRALPLLRLNHLLKVPHSSRALKRIGSNTINPAILRLILLVFWILLAAHLIACGWIFISVYPKDMTPVKKYLLAFYWTITTLTTIGYGDITPSGGVQIVYVIFIELVGAAMYGLVIGNIANLIANIDVAKTQYKEKLDKINSFLKYRNIPYPLQKKINSYYNYLWDSRRGYDESSVLEDLPAPLKVSVSLYLNKEIIAKVPIFEKASEDLIKDIILNLRPVVFTPGDYIVRSGEVGFDMYFISRGSVDVVSGDEKTVYATLTSGQFFGEIALLLSMPRTATIKAREYCDLYRLDKDSFDQVLTRYPEFAETIQELAEQRRAEQDVSGPQSDTAKEAKEITDIQIEFSGSAVQLTWNDVTDLSHYELVKKNPQTGRWRYLSKELEQPEYTDKHPTPEQNVYRIRAVHGTGPGKWSRPVQPEASPEDR